MLGTSVLVVCVRSEGAVGDFQTCSWHPKWEWPWGLPNYAGTKYKRVQLLSNGDSIGINV